MTAYRYEQRTVVVASAPSRAEADLIAVTLAAHGYEGVVASSYSPYPSIDFVEGVRVMVNAEDEVAVRELLAALGIPDGRVT